MYLIMGGDNLAALSRGIEAVLDLALKPNSAMRGIQAGALKKTPVSKIEKIWMNRLPQMLGGSLRQPSNIWTHDYNVALALYNAL